MPIARSTPERQGRRILLAAVTVLALAAVGRSQADAASLEADCQETAAAIQQKLGDECALVVHPPFVIAGNLPAAELDRWHTQTIAPAARAMSASYFRTAPDQPITILLLRDEASYKHFAERLYGDRGVSIYGYFKPLERALVMNIGTGGGTLVHELTHALIAFDFPRVPDWFNEGLASLHEQCRFRADESGIDGLPNWRLPILCDAVRSGKLRSLESLVRDNDFRQRGVGLNYAQARYFCLYMQQRGVLERFYRHIRDHQKDDPLGIAAVQQVFPDQTWEQLDKAFRGYCLKLQEQEAE